MFFKSEKRPLSKGHFRRANENDFNALYEIWMQDHILPFMFFEDMNKNDFYPIFENLLKHCEIYVIESEGQIIGVRRITYGTGNQSHIAYFGSFGVHKDFCGRGYGKQFYVDCIKHLKDNHPEISRIELTQETDNPSTAAPLSQKFDFHTFGVFPEWQPRETGIKSFRGKWPVGERFLEKILISPDNNVIDCDVFKPITPELLVKNPNGEIDIEVVKHEDSIEFNMQGTLAAKCNIENGHHRFKHIQFWSLEISDDIEDCKFLLTPLKQTIMDAAKNIKKIEIFSADARVNSLLQELGFHYRAKRTMGIKIGDKYYNTLGSDLSFYNIDDALKILSQPKKFLRANQETANKLEITESIEDIRTKIGLALESGLIDSYGQMYLENLTFQMTREATFESFYPEDNAPWHDLVRALPEELSEVQGSLMALGNKLDIIPESKPGPSPT